MRDDHVSICEKNILNIFKEQLDSVTRERVTGMVRCLYPKNHLILQWRGLSLYSRAVWVLRIATLEGSGFLGKLQISKPSLGNLQIFPDTNYTLRYGQV